MINLGVIPARYASSRFPGKPLVMVNGKPMIQRVYEQAAKALDHVVVATDDERIEKCVKDFNGRVLMTSEQHSSGTDRCYEALCLYEKYQHVSVDVVLNIQGDEPFIDPEQIQLVTDRFKNPGTQISTLIKKISDYDELFDKNRPKVVINNAMDAIYFSRNTIPYLRNHPENEWLNYHTFFKHIGLYAFKADVLKNLTQLEQSKLELSEGLEQNRWIENGFKIVVSETVHESYCIDTPGDLERIESMKF